ncbi:hypothetical protein AB205_0062240 [Aquarana catesbeiana]|uniref:Uncharacterized protein n=1 Tax=Aquarana catesbeiana TaxID=8400 RepID=A0A2G9RI76_AQUCT|nr:hypothetical protein AB205_0062240 [Aquarana catesbeiana]
MSIVNCAMTFLECQQRQGQICLQLLDIWLEDMMPSIMATYGVRCIPWICTTHGLNMKES